MATTTNKTNFLKIVAQICAMMVVVLHQFNVTGMQPHSVSAHIVGCISHGICAAAVPTFFCMSGYLFWGNADTIQDVLSKLKRRVKTVLFPFCLWNVFYALLFNVAQIGGGNLTLTEIISSVLFYKYYFPMWYMFQLMVYFLLSLLLFVLLKDNKITIAIIITCALVSVFYKSSVAIEIGGLSRPLIMFNFLCYYLIGALLSKKKKLLMIFESRIPKVWILIALFVLVAFLSHLVFDKYITIHYHRLLIPIVFLLFVLLMYKLISTKDISADIFHGVSPMAVYGMHGAVGLLFLNLFERVGFENSLLRYLILCLNSIVATVWVCYIIKQYLHKVYACFSGYR